MFKIGQIIDKDEYGAAANFCNAHPEKGWIVTTNADRFQIVAAPSLTDDEMADLLRTQRDNLLAATDKYMIPDFPATDDVRAAYRKYREYLRNIPQTSGFPHVEIMDFDTWQSAQGDENV